jgi:pimeloyl-ACP methyl ester carboxylesterase
LFLHGFNGPHWSPLLDRLSAHYRVLAPEHPGFGRSAIPDWMQGIGDLALFYLDVLEALDLRDVHLVGHAVGGWIAAELAVRNTSRVATLSLLAPAGIVVPGVSIADVFLIPTDDLVHRQVHDAETPGAAEWIRTASAMEIDLVLENRAALARIGWSPRLHNPQLPFWLHRIDVPALVAWGQEDRIVPFVCHKPYLERIPGCGLLALPASGHALPFERGDEVARGIEKLIAGVRR